MEIGQKIKQLRYKSALTQEQLAESLGISAQSVSKWETAVTMPDITLLPMLSEIFGVSIDELFDLTTEQTLRRIENRMEREEEFTGDVFKEYEDFLKNQLVEHQDRRRILSLLASLYHHRMQSDARRVSKYAREAIKIDPAKKECQWLLQMADGQSSWDWNVANHTSIINFYKQVIESDEITPKTPLPYYYLIDNLLADHRTKEAREYLKIYQTLPAHEPCLVPVYEAHIALAEYEESKADAIMEQALEEYGQDSIFLFEAAQYYARKCAYEKAIKYYELSWQAEENKKPRYIDALQGMVIIYEILGDYKNAVATQERMIDNLVNEWHFLEDDSAVLDAVREKNRLLQKV